MNGIPIERILLERFVEKNKTIAVAESCTGGFLSHLLTRTPNASKVFKAGLVCYNVVTKIEFLGIQPEIIKKYTVVSEQVAQAMAQNVRSKFKTDFGIATTGNAGPTKDKTHRAVGDLCVGIATEFQGFSKTFHFDSSREIFIKQASTSTLRWLLELTSSIKI